MVFVFENKLLEYLFGELLHQYILKSGKFQFDMYQYPINHD